MTNSTPIPINLPPERRLALLPGRRGCTPSDVRLLLGLQRSLERVTLPHMAIAQAIVRKLEGAA